jgi:hypothetical protein
MGGGEPARRTDKRGDAVDSRKELPFLFCELLCSAWHSSYLYWLWSLRPQRSGFRWGAQLQHSQLCHFYPAQVAVICSEEHGSITARSDLLCSASPVDSCCSTIGMRTPRCTCIQSPVACVYFSASLAAAAAGRPGWCSRLFSLSSCSSQQSFSVMFKPR